MSLPIQKNSNTFFKYYISNEISFKSFTILPSKTFKTSRNIRRRQKSTRVNNTTSKQFKHTPKPGFAQQIQTQNLTRLEVDFPNERCQSVYHTITLSGLKLQEFPFFWKALLRQKSKDIHSFTFFQNFTISIMVCDDRQGPIHPTLFSSSHHERRLSPLRSN